MSPTNHRFTLTIDGETFHVELGDLSSSPVEVVVNGQTYTVQLETDRPDTGDAAPERPTSQTPAIVRNQPERSGDGQLGRDVLAPMPGDILEIKVGPGDQVSAGQPLCSLEAMKMKNTIRAPRAGEIATVHVNEGQTVTHGDLLMSFE